ncbi:MAG: hypothetical protein ACE5JB_15080 [bacterium]
MAGAGHTHLPLKEKAVEPDETINRSTQDHGKREVHIATKKIILSMDEGESRLSEYMVMRGGWQISNVNGNNILKAEGDGFLLFPWVEEHENIYLQHDFKLNQGSYKNYFRMRDDLKYTINIRGNEITLQKEISEHDIIILDSVNKEINREEWHNIRIIAKDNRLIVLLDQNILFNIVDPEPIIGGRVVFETQGESQILIDNIEIAVDFDDSLVIGECFTENFENESLLLWNFSQQVDFGSIVYNKVLVLKGESKASLNITPQSEFYTLEFSYIPGINERILNGEIILQSIENEMEAYKLIFTGHQLILSKILNREEILITATDCVLKPNYIHNIYIYMLRDYMHVKVDEKDIILVENIEPFIPSKILFNSHGSENNFIGINNLKIESLEEKFAERLKDVLKVQAKPEKPYNDLYEKSKIPTMGNVIPLKVEIFDSFYNGKKRTFMDGTINPGPVPPNFVHTWAIDVKNMDKFNIHFKKVNLAPDDVLKVFIKESFIQKNAKGQYTAPLPLFYATGSSTYNLTANLKNLKGNNEDIEYTWNSIKKTYKRVYIQLETSETKKNREFVIDGLETLTPTGTEEALLVGDNIRYDDWNPGSVIQVEDVKLQMGGKPIKLIKPLKKFWVGQVTHPKPERKDGWYLLGQIFKEEGQGFFALAYYNERKSRVRVYLYNYGVKQGTGYSVRFSLAGLFKTPAAGYNKKWIDQFQELKGAIFPMHPNPKRWSDCVIVLPGEYSLKSSDPRWSYNSWISVEVPMLIPMAEKIPASKLSPYQNNKSPYGSSYYRSVYDEKLKNNFRNILFKIQVASYYKGQINGHIVAKAIGQAIQGKTTKFATEMNNWLSNGYSISKTATDAWSSINTWAEQEKQKTSVTDFLSKGGDIVESLVSIGSGIFSQSWGSVFSGLGSLGKTIYSFFKEPEILKLGMELDMQGILKGKVIIKSTPQEAVFFLPGRFSIEEAFRSGIQMEVQALVNSFIPRYDRRMGLFGYIYNPGDITFNILRTSYSDFDFTYPTQFKVNPKLDTKKMWTLSGLLRSLYIDYTLPIIYNPYGEIVPVKPITTGNLKKINHKPESEWNVEDSKWYIKYYWTYDVSWKNHVTPEWDDSSFPTKSEYKEEAYSMRVHVFGYNVKVGWGSNIVSYETLPFGTLMQVLPKISYAPRTFNSFKELKFLKVHTNHVLTWYNNKVKNPNWKSSFPIDDVMYYWDQPYFYYGRSRKDNNGNVPRSYETAHFRSPVTIKTMTANSFDQTPSSTIYTNRSSVMKTQ